MAARNIAVPDIERLAAESLAFDYDERADSLYIFLAPSGTPGVSVAIDEHVLLRVAPESEQLIAIEIEGFLTSAVQNDPRLLAFAEMANIPEDVMSRWRTSEGFRKVEAKAIRQLIEDSLGATAE